jgi:hypothetical protein
MDSDMIRERILSLQRDLDFYADGGRPTEDELNNAPIAEMWRPGRYPASGRPCIYAQRILGHQKLGTVSDYCSSPVDFVDLDGGWARTQGRLIRLGRRDPTCSDRPVLVVKRPAVIAGPSSSTLADEQGVLDDGSKQHAGKHDP